MKLVVYATVTDRVFSVNQLFITHPEYRPFFYEGKSPPRNDDYNRIVSVAEYILDFCSSLQENRRLLQVEGLPGRRGRAAPTDISWGEWTKYIEDITENSPILCRLLLERREWYEDDLWALSPLSRDKIKCELTDLDTNKPLPMDEERIDRVLHLIFSSEGCIDDPGEGAP